MLSLRLSKVLDKIVGGNQFGFIPGHNIADLLRGIVGVSEYMRLESEHGGLLSVYFQKAFDTISVPYITAAFEKFGFGGCFKWPNTILSSRKCSVQYGDHISEPFGMNRRVRQGCPLSPLLFVVAVELTALK